MSSRCPPDYTGGNAANVRYHGLRYHGLRNQGATCYLNSVLQVLFMTKEFREAVERGRCDSEYIDGPLKELFRHLGKNTASTDKITEALGIYTVYEQQDAAECFEKILTRLHNPVASEIFQGQMSHQITCSSCHQVSNTDGPFWSLPLALVKSDKNYSVVHGIDKYFKATNLTEGNQIYCDECKAKSDATTKFVIKHHPEVLTLLLKRFKWDYHRRCVKNESRVKVPYTLQIPENQTYELYAFVDHCGSLRGGHYTATVKSQDDEQWFQFNDTAVSPLDHQPLQVDSSQTAYLLFYKRNKPIGGRPPASSGSCDQSQTPDKTIKRKEDNKYRGLTNKGTPYLNSVLQVLFWTKDFREAVERHTSGNPEFTDLLRALFDDLQSSDQRTADTSEIISKLGIDSVYEQRDAAEYLEKILRLTSPGVSQIFHGELTHKTICCKSHEEGNTKEQFWHLSLALLDSNTEDYSVAAGIEEYFRETNFSGDNQMYCDQCDDKVDAITKCEITRHPEVLVLLLKRFNFYYRYKRYVKNNRPVGIPCTLHIPQGQTYELYAVVDHRGDLRSGHYTAIIKSQDDERWFNFSDNVTMLHPQPFQWGDTVRSYSAYLLFYKRNKPSGGRPPASSGSCDQSQTPDETIKREEGEEAAEVGNGTEQAVSIERNEEPGHGDMASVESNRRGLSPDASQDSRVYVRQGDSHGDLLAAHGNKKERYELEIMKNDEEKMAGNAEADDQIEKRGLLSVEAQQDCDGAGLDVGQKQPQKDLEATVIHNIPVKSKDDCEDIERNRDSDRSTGHEESQRRGHTSTKYTDMDPKCQVSEGLDDVRQNIIKDQGGKQEAEQDDGLTPIRVTQQGDKEKMEVVVKDDNRGNVDADEQTSRGGKLLTKNDVRKYNLSKHHEGCKQRDSGRLYKRSEQQTEEKMKQKRKDDEPAQRKGTSTTKPSLNEGAEDQHKKRLADVGQNSPEQETTVTHTTHRGGVEKRVREQEHKRDEHTEITEDTSYVQVGSGSKRPTAGQGAGRVDKTEEIHVMKTQKKKKRWWPYCDRFKVQRKDKMKQNRTTGFVEKKTKSSCFIIKQRVEPDDPAYGSSH